jgi:hypothetical protein
MNKDFADMSDAEIDAWVQELAEKHKAGVLDVSNATDLDSEDFFQLLACFEYNPNLVVMFDTFYHAVYDEAARRYVEDSAVTEASDK